MKVRVGLAKPKNLLLAIVLLVPIIAYLGSYFGVPARAISTVGNSSSSVASPSPSQRGVVRSTNGTIVAVYNSGSQAPTGLAFRTSTDNAATWSAATQIDTTQSTNFSIAIDSLDNIEVVFTNLSVNSSVLSRKLSYSGGSWSVGVQGTVFSGGCAVGSADTYGSPTIAINSSNVIWVNAGHSFQGDGISNCAAGVPSYDIVTSKSSDGSTWIATGTMATLSSMQPAPIIALGNALWSLVDDGTTTQVVKDLTSSGAWSLDATLTAGTLGGSGAFSIASAGSDELDILYSDLGIGYKKYTISTKTLGTKVSLTSSSNDVKGTITASSNGKLWAFYSSYVGVNSYNIVYKSYNGSVWDSSPTSITTDNANNRYFSSILSVTGSHLPMIWTTGTASPYTINGNDLTISSNATPAAPTLIAPANSATGQLIDPQFQLRTTDAESDYLKYKIEICSDSGCGTVVKTIDQTASQSGWAGQDASSGTAYVGNSVITSSTIAKHKIQSTNKLKGNTQYWWRAFAIDPAGSNTFSSASGIFSFTTEVVNINISPGINITPGATIQP